MKKYDISVVICTYNRAEMLSLALKSITSQNTDGKVHYEIIVVDDGSNDATKDVVKDITEHSVVPIRYIRDEGEGIARARNSGVFESTGEWIAFFDDDQIAEKGWLKELFDFAYKKNALCVGGSRHLIFLDQAPKNLSAICRNILGEIVIENDSIVCGRKNMPCTGNVLLNRKVFDIVGGFDESIKRGGEDGDFFQKVRMAGIQAWNIRQAVVHHLTPPYRLRSEYMLWTSMRWGDWFAYRDYKEWGLGKTILVCMARIMQVLFVNLPFLLFAVLKEKETEITGRKCLIWRTVAYARKTIFLVAPKIFAQDKYFINLEFRKERAVFKDDPNIINIC